jgi:hypothetical protein
MKGESMLVEGFEVSSAAERSPEGVKSFGLLRLVGAEH